MYTILDEETELLLYEAYKYLYYDTIDNYMIVLYEDRETDIILRQIDDLRKNDKTFDAYINTIERAAQTKDKVNKGYNIPDIKNFIEKLPHDLGKYLRKFYYDNNKKKDYQYPDTLNTLQDILPKLQSISFQHGSEKRKRDREEHLERAQHYSRATARDIEMVKTIEEKMKKIQKGLNDMIDPYTGEKLDPENSKKRIDTLKTQYNVLRDQINKFGETDNRGLIKKFMDFISNPQYRKAIRKVFKLKSSMISGMGLLSKIKNIGVLASAANMDWLREAWRNHIGNKKLYSNKHTNQEIEDIKRKIDENLKQIDKLQKDANDLKSGDKSDQFESDKKTTIDIPELQKENEKLRARLKRIEAYQNSRNQKNNEETPIITDAEKQPQL